VGPITRSPALVEGQTLRSPGLLRRHYATRMPLECVPADGWQRVRELRQRGLRVGWLTFGPHPHQHDPEGGVTLMMPTEPGWYAAELYSALHTLECAEVDRIVVALPPEGDEWLAVRDRLNRASAPV